MQASPLYGYWFKAVQDGVHYASFYKVGGQAVHDGGTGWRYMMAVHDGGQHTLLPLSALRLVLQGQSTWEDAPRPILPLHSISLHHKRGAPLFTDHHRKCTKDLGGQDDDKAAVFPAPPLSEDRAMTEKTFGPAIRCPPPSSSFSQAPTPPPGGRSPSHRKP